MTLLEAIKANASEQATAGDYAAVAAILNAQSINVSDSTYYTSRYLVTLLGPDNYRLVSGSLAAIGSQDPLVKDIHQTLNTTGVDFSTELTQGMIDLLGANAGWSQELIDTLKAIGRSKTSLAIQELGSAVTAEQCEAAWMRDILTATVRDRSATARYGIEGGSITTLEQLNAVLGGV